MASSAQAAIDSFNNGIAGEEIFSTGCLADYILHDIGSLFLTIQFLSTQRCDDNFYFVKFFDKIFFVKFLKEIY